MQHLECPLLRPAVSVLVPVSVLLFLVGVRIDVGFDLVHVHRVAVTEDSEEP